MKKDLLVLALSALLIALLCPGTKIQSVNEYCLTHIDGITEGTGTVALSIRCDTILENRVNIDPALQSEPYMPEGVILASTEYVLRPGDTVFDVPDHAARHNRIRMEFQSTSENSYGSIYVQGIHYLYECSCGPLSGWMYCVKGEFPNVGCSKYTLRGSDVIKWVYTCDLGRDVGCLWMGGQNQ